MVNTREDEWVVTVDAQHFNAGLVVASGRIVDAAPILRWARGRSLTWFRTYAARNGWAVRGTPPLPASILTDGQHSTPPHR